MITLLFVLLCVLVAWLVFDAIYSLIVCRYFHTKLKYQPFALRDCLRTVRIENPSMGDNVFKMMELRINGTIRLVREVSFLRALVALFTEPPVSEKENESALEMKKAIQWIVDNSETELGKQLFDIETQSMRVFRDSFIYNSPYVALLYRYVIKPVARLLPQFAEKFRKTKEDFMRETVPTIMVYAAR